MTLESGMHRNDKLIMVGAGIGLVFAVGMFLFGGPPKSPGTIQRPRPANETPAERAAARAKVAEKQQKIALGDLVEVPPSPGGVERELNSGQIAFCLAQTIRVEAARPVVSGPEQEQRFDAMVKDVNSRCGKYSYKQKAYDYAKSSVDRNAAALRRQGVDMFQKQP